MDSGHRVTVSLRSLLQPGHRVSPETILLGKFQILDRVTGLLGQFRSLCDWVTWSPGHNLLTRLVDAVRGPLNMNQTLLLIVNALYHL